MSRSDSTLLFEAGAGLVLLAGPDEAAVRLHLPGRELEEDTAIDLAMATSEQLDGSPPQVVLVEGYRHAHRPVIVVGEPATGEPNAMIWMALPAVRSLQPRAFEAALNQLTALVREHIG